MALPLLPLSLVVATLAQAPAPAATVPLQRHSLVIGANFGGSDRPRLKYAVSDAERFARVLVELGGVLPANQIVLRQPSLREMLDAIELLNTRIVAAERATPGAAARTEIVVYYSGHADEKGLLLGEDRVSYRSLRDRLDEIPADVRIAVLDACASGAFTRLKGGTARPAFMVDASSAMRGHAFLTSSAETEAAQESDRIGASYFTHYLVSGFRGAADLSGDGRVTLSEAYQFAFAETVGRTVGTAGGTQHPSYDINLSGSGDVVMTDVRQTTSTLVLGEELDGRVYIRNASRQLVVELNKRAGRRVEIGLEPGAYDVRLERDKAFATRIQAVDGARIPLDLRQFSAAAIEPTRRRGDETMPFAVAGRTRVSIVNGLWGNRGWVEVAGRRFDMFGGVQVSYFFSDRLGLAAGAELYAADADVDIIGGLAAPITLQYQLFENASAHRVKPFVTGGGIIVSGSDAGEGRHTTIGLQVGSGIDVQLQRSVALSFKGAYNVVPKPGGRTRPSNYEGFQVSLGVGWLFGPPR